MKCLLAIFKIEFAACITIPLTITLVYQSLRRQLNEPDSHGNSWQMNCLPLHRIPWHALGCIAFSTEHMLAIFVLVYQSLAADKRLIIFITIFTQSVRPGPLTAKTCWFLLYFHTMRSQPQLIYHWKKENKNHMTYLGI